MRHLVKVEMTCLSEDLSFLISDLFQRDEYHQEFVSVVGLSTVVTEDVLV